MAIDPLLEERQEGEEEETRILCHGAPDEEEPEERPIVCHGAPDEEEPEERPIVCHGAPDEEERPPILCHGAPGEEEIEEVIIEQTEIEEELGPPLGLAERWRAKAGEGPEDDFEPLWTELTTFLRACAGARRPLRPPSARVDDLWHEFILFTREYHAFCNRLGGYVHHVPDVPGSS